MIGIRSNQQENKEKSTADERQGGAREREAASTDCTVNHDLKKKHTCLRDDESVKLTERLVANLVGINQLSFLPCTYATKKRKENYTIKKQYLYYYLGIISTSYT